VSRIPVDAFISQLRHVFNECLVGTHAIVFGRVIEAHGFAINDERLNFVALVEAVRATAVVATEVGYLIVVTQPTTRTFLQELAELDEFQ